MMIPFTKCSVAVWTNNVSNDTVTLGDIIKLLDDGDVSNSVIDGFALVLENMQAAMQKTSGNIVYFLSTCWVNGFPLIFSFSL